MYTAPFIWIPSDKVQISGTKPKFTTYDRFHVTQIIYKDSRIVALAIKNASINKMAFVYDIRDKGKS